MGALFDGVCFSSQAEALDRYYGGAPVAHTAGAISYSGSWEKVADVWQWVVMANDGGVVTTTSTAAPVVAFPVCDPMAGFNDGQAVGWAFAVVLFLAWGSIQIRKQVR